VVAQVTVKPSYGLSDGEIARMLQESAGHAKDDMVARALREQQIEARQLLEAVQNALDQNGADLLDEAEQARIMGCMATTRELLEGNDHLAIKRAVHLLNEATVVFAQRRMDKSVSHALTGHNISELEN
jgi:molecular chaperone HscA